MFLYREAFVLSSYKMGMKFYMRVIGLYLSTNHESPFCNAFVTIWQASCGVNPMIFEFSWTVQPKNLNYKNTMDKS